MMERPVTEQNGKTPQLELISNHPSQRESGVAQEFGERRRRPRLNLAAEQFRLAANGKVFSVVDLSTEGMGLRVLDRTDFLLFPVAMRIEGTLKLKGSKYPVKARVARLGIDLVGCEFLELAPEAQSAIGRFLDPEVLGREIKPIPAGDGGTLWYHGPSGTDLYLVRGMDGQYRRMTIYVLGSFVQWDVELGLATGSTEPSKSLSSSEDELWGVVRQETLLMRDDKQPDSQKLKIAKALLLSSNLPQDLKKWCVRHLEITPANPAN